MTIHNIRNKLYHFAENLARAFDYNETEDLQRRVARLEAEVSTNTDHKSAVNSTQ